ncbi:glycosyltransferase family A protein [Gangjinia marincola]|uniref:Glycosyltransferase family A protein n=1 Tax=Gangjinia marincola TaxID=578463 RepID=A0ABN1MKR8_9FLAO
MNICIVISAHNEEEFLAQTLDSILAQTLQPVQLIVVDDNSSDQTFNIASDYAKQHKFLSVVKNSSSDEHLPGSKVINAFNEGLKHASQAYDVICKFDADLIFPKEYLEQIVNIYANDPRVGMAAGLCTVFNGSKWITEGATNKDHIRGALKSYRKACFEEVGGLDEAMGWDTADELKARFFGWKVTVTEQLLVRHLRPTGHNYSNAQALKQGEALYKLRYSFALAMITALKMAWNKNSIGYFSNYLKGFKRAKTMDSKPIVSKEQGAFIRAYRWRNLLKKLG